MKTQAELLLLSEVSRMIQANAASVVHTGQGGSLPAGGKTGSVLTKNSDSDYDAGWDLLLINLDGGQANSTYGGISPINCGGA